MSPSPTKESTIAALREPEFMSDLCIHISEGGTLHKYLRERSILYGMAFEWIMGDDARKSQYETAVKARRANHEDRVIAQILAASEADIRKVFDQDGEVLPPHEIPDEVAAGLASYEIVMDRKTGTKTFKTRLVDRTRNAELLGKTSALFKDSTELKGVLTLEEILKNAHTKVSNPA